MKRARNLKVLSFLMCFMFLFFVGCGGPDSLGGDNPTLLGGVKVLSRPDDYDFKEAVGSEASENYYNIFAREILTGLNGVYNNNNSLIQTQKTEYFKNIDTVAQTGVNTYENFGTDMQYYLYDSIRYTITDLTDVKNESDVIISQQLTLADSAWNWSVQSGSNFDNGTVFEQLVNDGYNSLVQINTNKINIVPSGFMTSWHNIYTEDTLLKFTPNYTEFYDSIDEKFLEGSTTDTDFWNSPYYDEVKDTADEWENPSNYFQDAFEYATYLFVLGYDYQDEAGAPSEDAAFFDFEIEYESSTGAVKGMNVGGWEENKISISDALGRVKTLYQEIGGFVGITQTNKDDLVGFVLDIVIGDKALGLEEFEVEYSSIQSTGGVLGSEILDPTRNIKFDRNYALIVENIVNYACDQAPIGTNADGENVSLNESYLASEITDYQGNYFFLYADEEGNDEDAFKYIAAAEYQSMVLSPMLLDVGKPITDIWLAFEYYENNDPSKVMLEELEINVGFRYFDAEGNNGAGEIIFEEETNIKVIEGINGSHYREDKDTYNPDVNWVYIGHSKSASEVYDIHMDNQISLGSVFNGNIGGGVINPFVSGTTISPGYAVKTLTGNDAAKDFYKLNDSSSFGSYGTLNEDAFSVNQAAADACDFIEIYFDVVKDKNVTGVNYNFKVGLMLFAVEDV